MIFIHASSEGVSFGNRTDLFTGVLFFLNKSFSFAVPAFIFASALKMTLKFKDVKITYHYLLRRITKIYLPYIFWVVIYYSYFVSRHYFDFSLRELAAYILNGTLAAHFYFVVIIMQFYILMPLLLLAAKKTPAFIGFALSLALTLIFRLFIPVDLHIFDFLPADRWFLGYLVFWMAGVYCALKFEAFTNFTNKYKTVILTSSMAMLFIHVSLSYANYTGAYNYSKYAEAMQIFFCLAMVFGFYAFCTQAPNLFQKFFAEAGKTTYYVYLSHVLVLLAVEEFIIKPQYWLVHSLLIKMLLTYTIPFAGAYLYVRLFKKKPIKSPQKCNRLYIKA